MTDYKPDGPPRLKPSSETVKHKPFEMCSSCIKGLHSREPKGPCNCECHQTLKPEDKD